VGTVFLIPLAAFKFGAKESIGILTLYFLFQNMTKIYFFRNHIEWKVAKTIIIWGIPGAAIGACALSIIPDLYFRKFLGVAIFIFMLKDLHSHMKNKDQQPRLDLKWVPPLGFLYGVTTGLFGIGNVVKGPLFLSLNILKESYLGTNALTSFFTHFPKI